jgi:hypothetical protein
VIEDLIAMEKKATPGEWQADQCGDFWTRAETELVDEMEIYRGLGSTRYAPDDPNAIFIVSIRNAAASLLEEVRASREVIKNVASQVTWYDGNKHDVILTYGSHVETAQAHLAKFVNTGEVK